MREIAYKARDIGYGVEEDVVQGTWGEERDWTGKREFQVEYGRNIWLFDDEIVYDVELPTREVSRKTR